MYYADPLIQLNSHPLNPFVLFCKSLLLKTGRYQLQWHPKHSHCTFREVSEVFMLYGRVRQQTVPEGELQEQGNLQSKNNIWVR